jgi:flap endonuclease-1
LAKRTKKRKEAEEAAVEAKEEGDQEALAKLNKRTLRVTQQHHEEAKKLLALMGIPYVEAPCEAEAQCAAMVAAGVCYGAGSEDMDSLTLGTPLLLRHLNYSESRGLPILEIRLEKVLEGLKMDMDQFIDLCILLGCDYCDSIRGIGPVRAVQLIEKYKNIEAILESLDKEKYKVPDNFPFVEIRELFKHPEVADPNTLDIKWNAPDEQGLIEFLVQQKGFSEDRVRRGVEKLNKSRTAAVQDRITSFFKVEKKDPPVKKEELKKTSSKKSAAVSKAAPAKAKPEPKAEPSSVPAPTLDPSSTTIQPENTPVKSETKESEPAKTTEPVVTTKAPIHPFFHPRKTAAPVAPKSPPKVSETKPESKPEVPIVRRGRIVEDDGDE